MYNKKFNFDLAKGNTKKGCRSLHPSWFTTKEFMSLPPNVRFLYIALMCFCDCEGRLIKTLDDFIRQFAYADFETEEEVEEALKMLVKNGLIIIYPYTAEGYTVELIQIVDYSKMQTGKAYKKGSSDFPAPDGYEDYSSHEVNGEKNETDDRFQVFYDSYPRKYKKPEAEKVWIQIDPNDDEYQIIMNGLANWIPYFSSIDTKYIPIAETFLKNKMYQDFPPAEKNTPEEKKKPTNIKNNQTLENLWEWMHDGDCPSYNDFVNQFCYEDSDDSVFE